MRKKNVYDWLQKKPGEWEAKKNTQIQMNLNEIYFIIDRMNLMMEI